MSEENNHENDEITIDPEQAADEENNIPAGALLTLQQIANITGISYVTLTRYNREHSAEIPTVGEGRKRLYPVEAIEVYKRLREGGESRRGRPKNDTAEPKPRKDRKSRPAAIPTDRKGPKKANARRSSPRMTEATRPTSTKTGSSLAISAFDRALSELDRAQSYIRLETLRRIADPINEEIAAIERLLGLEPGQNL